MAIVSDIEIRLRADIARLQQDMTAARRSVDTAMSGVTKSVEIAKNALLALGVGIGLKDLVMQVVDAQREFDKLNASLVTATGSVSGAGQAFSALQRFAAQTPYSVTEATEAFIKLRNLGLNPGEKALTSYGNTAASMGKNLNQLIEAVADATTGEFERLKEFGIKAKQNGDLVNFTFQGTTKTVGNNAKDIQKYLMDIGNINFAGAMEKRLNTLDGAISNLGDAWQSTLRSISSGGFGEGLQSMVLALSNALGDLGDIFKAVGGEATAEGGKVKEAAGLHMALTETFKLLAIAGVGLTATFREISSALTALNSIGKAKDLQGIKDAIALRAKEAKEIDDWTLRKIAAIQGAVEAGNKARDAETANVKKNGGDQLAQFEIVLNAEQARDKALADSLEVRNKLDGVDSQAAGNLKKLKAALDTGGISQDQYNRYVAQATKETTLASTAYKNNQKVLDGQAEAIARASEAQGLYNQREQQRIAFMKQSGQFDEQDAINQASDETILGLYQQIDAQHKLMAIARQRIDSQKEQEQIDGNINKLQAQIATARDKREQDTFLLEQQRYKLAVNNTADLIEAAQGQSKTQRDATRDMQDEIDTLGMTGVALAQVTAARLRDRAAALDRRAEIGMIEEVNDELRQQADELRKQADLGLTKAKVEEQQKFWGSIEQTAHDTFVSIADGGKGAFTRLKESAKNIFFEWLYQMTLKKWIVNIGTSVDGPGSVAGIASGNGSSNLLSSASSLTSIWSAFSKGFNGSLGGAVTKAGDLFGSSAVSAFGDGIANGSAVKDAAAAYSAAGNTTVASSLNAGAMVSQYIPIVAATVASYFGAKAIAGDYKVKGIGTALNYLGLAGGVVNRLFGMGSKQYSDNSTLSGVLSGNGFSGNTSTAYTQKGGLFRSDRSGSDTTAVDAATAAQLGSAYDTILQTTTAYAKAIGASSDMIANRTQSLSLVLGKDNDANQKAITDFFTGVSDSVARDLLPTIGDFQQGTETASATLQRLVGDFTGIDTILKGLGTDAMKAFGVVGTESISARESLIKLAGGLDVLASQAQYFVDNFESAATKTAPLIDQVNSVLSSIGYSGLKTIEQYEQAVVQLQTSGALATEQGQKVYETLLALAPAFKQVNDYLLALKKTAQDAAAGALDRLSQAVDLEKSNVTKTYDNAMTALQKQLDGVNAAIARTTELSQALKGALQGVQTPDQMAGSRAVAQAQIATAVAIAKASGVLPSAADLADALQTLQQGSGDQYSSLLDYQRDVARTNAQLQALGGLSDNQLNTAQLQLQTLQAQQAQAEAAHNDDLARLDAIVETAKGSLDAVNGIYGTLQGVDSAYAWFVKYLTSLQNVGGSNSPVGPPAMSSPDNIYTPPAYFYRSDSNSDTVANALQSMADRLSAIETHSAATASATRQYAGQFDQATGGGGPLLVTQA